MTDTVRAANDTEAMAPASEPASELPTGVQRLPSGRYRPRISVNGRLESLGTRDTPEEASAVRTAALAQLQDAPVPVTAASSLRSLEAAFFKARERAGLRNVQDDRNRWSRNVTGAPFYDWPVKAIRHTDVKEWVDAMSARLVDPPHAPNRRPTTPKKRFVRRAPVKRVARQTVVNAKNILSAFFQWLLERGMVSENPVRGVKVRAESKTCDPITFLRPKEQYDLLSSDVIPEAERLLIAWQMYTGMRPGETASLRSEDVHLDDEHFGPHVTVRYGSRGGATKTGRIRHVALIGMAIDVARRWVALRPTWVLRNPKELMWPTRRGRRRQDDRLIPGWHEFLKAAGVRRIRIYDLRHTTATSLLCGWWGRAWSMHEIAGMLGHSSTKVTEKHYAFLDRSAMRAAAEETGGSASPWSAGKNP